ncbi:MAG: helical backbone metal receptor [Gammaproteobacteria bacterium]|nr:helical backbone metal receptor [Gammaproteobacteria bacterium]
MTRALALACLCVALCACSEPNAPAPGPGAAQRVVTFSPHLAEIMFAVGAGDQLVGVSAWSDYPRAVLELPEVGDAFTIDQEALTLLQPDLLLVWESGMPAHTVDELRQRGYRVEAIRSRNLEEVAAAVRRVGDLTGQQASAANVAADFVEELAALRAANVDADPIDVFFQISARPLYTVNREHFISEIIALCGGRNIFEDLGIRARRVGRSRTRSRSGSHAGGGQCRR